MHITEQAEAIHVIGIELRTTNAEAFQTIPAHWQRFNAEAVPAQVPGRTGETVYAVYTHFEHAGRNNQGLYSLVLGLAVTPDAAVPPGMVRAVVPASHRAVFPIENGRLDLVGATWQTIWQRGDLPKTFIADYERYGADGSIDIQVGIDGANAAK